jgi:hypothetical protein
MQPAFLHFYANNSFGLTPPFILDANPSRFGLTASNKHLCYVDESGTLWTNINRIIETSLFANSQFASMIQNPDICAFSLRRYFIHGEEELFNPVFKRADTTPDGKKVGVRHFTKPG